MLMIELKIMSVLALVMWGEYPDLLGPDQELGAALVCHTFLNRLSSPSFPDDPALVAENGYWGWQQREEAVPDWIFRIAEDCVLEPDPTGGAFYVFSRQDLTNRWWAWDEATAQAGSGTHSLRTFRDLPEELPRLPVLAP